MVQKQAGVYTGSAETSNYNNDTLLLEIARGHVACMVRQARSKQVTSLEYFTIDKDKDDWDDVFYEVRRNSDLLHHSFEKTRVYYNFEEAILIPTEEFNEATAPEFLNIIHPNNIDATIGFDHIKLTSPITNVYKVDTALHNGVNSNFFTVKPKHIYTKFIANIFDNNRDVNVFFIKVQFYKGKFIAGVVKNRVLQIVQTFHFASPEDVLYHLLNIAQKFQMPAAQIQLEISGMIDPQSQLFGQLQRTFAKLSIEEVEDEFALKQALTNYPPHYFAPFFNLAL